MLKKCTRKKLKGKPKSHLQFSNEWQTPSDRVGFYMANSFFRGFAQYVEATRIKIASNSIHCLIVTDCNSEEKHEPIYDMYNNLINTTFL